MRNKNFLILAATLALTSCGKKIEKELSEEKNPIQNTLSYSVSNDSNFQILDVNGFRMNLIPEKYEISGNDITVTVKNKLTGLEVLQINADQSVDGQDRSISELYNSGSSVDIDVVSRKQKLKFSYAALNDNELLDNHIQSSATNTAKINLTNSLIEIGNNYEVSSKIREAHIISHSEMLGKPMTLKKLKLKYFTENDKVLFLRECSRDGIAVSYERLSSIDSKTASESDFKTSVIISSIGENYKQITFKIENDGSAAFLIDNPLAKSTFPVNCRKYRKDSDLVSERLLNGIKVSLFLKKDIFEKCIGDKEIKGSVRAFDENLDYIKVNY